MTLEPKIEEAAEGLFRLYGAEAVDEARRVAERLSGRKDQRPAAFWRQVVTRWRHRMKNKKGKGDRRPTAPKARPTTYPGKTDGQISASNHSNIRIGSRRTAPMKK
jgi:hypothetical protein